MNSPQHFSSHVDAQIRWMIRRDMPEVLDIEQQSFEFAWTEEDFLCCLRQRNCIGMVAERQERQVEHVELVHHRAHRADAPGALLGGRVRRIRRELRVMCRPDQIPEALEVDVSPLDVVKRTAPAMIVAVVTLALIMV